MARTHYVLVTVIVLAIRGVARAQEPEPEPGEEPVPSAYQAPPEVEPECPPEEEADDAPSYGDADTWELGGSVGGMWTEDVFTLNIFPSIGYFVIDYLELSLNVAVEYENVRDDDGSRHDETTFGVLFEPSYHIPVIDEDLFVLGGLGLGVGYDGVTVGFDIVPRVGMNIALGPGRMLNPSIRVPIIIGGEEDDNGDTEFNTSVSFGFDIGYSTVF
ncbi:hypothetical protein [Sandaracinus amylolyticus]|uniref:hypothetical protein n=1 Tax=Sandaracinus amylolyticus TaxID=927083 RepID=UPI001F4224F7|nr:hypothetical protein [Sandaracinus amylolyticus]UJR85512.1 Hypothetical protein I5071_75920 [Sandaracinus amylolyticus]